MLFSTCNYVMNILSTYKSVCYPSVQSLSSVQCFVTPWTTAYQVPCPSPTPRVYSNSCPSVWWCQPTISSSVIPFSSCLHSFQASGSFPVSQFFASSGQRIGVSASASILPVGLKTDFLYDGLVRSPCSPRDSQESFPITPQFKCISSSVFSFLYSPTLTSIQD